MYPAREVILQALFDKIVAGLGTEINYSSRRFSFWNDLTAEQKPAFLMTELPENNPDRQQTILYKRQLNVVLWYYLDASDKTIIYATQINNFLDKLEDILKPSPMTGEMTLGDKVCYCRIQGDIFKDPGDTDQQAIAVVPVKILVP